MRGTGILATCVNARRVTLLGALFVLSAIGGLTPSLAGQQQNQVSKPPGQPAGQGKKLSTATDQSTQGATTSSHYLKITINPSTANIIQGAVYGLDAEIENISNEQVTVDVGKIQLAVQPELAPPDISCTWLYNAGSNTALPSPLVMQPGDHFTIFFDTGRSSDGATVPPDCKADLWGRLRRRLDFVPGKYSFMLTGTFSIPVAAITSAQSGASPATAADTAESSTKSDEHYFTEMVSLPVTIDQFQIIIYAGLGGLLAFLVMSLRSSGTLSEYAAKLQAGSTKPHPKSLIIARQAAAAILVSVTVTVVASRLTSTSFPVRVSVEDFWGAFTVGFVSYFIGGKFIDKLAEIVQGPPLPAAAAPGAAPARQAAPAAAPGAAPAEGGADPLSGSLEREISSQPAAPPDQEVDGTDKEQVQVGKGQ